MKQNKVTVVGSTSWGITLCNILSENVDKLFLLSRNDEENKNLNRARYISRNQKFNIEKNIIISNFAEEIISESNIIIIAVPSANIEENIDRICNYITEDHVIISAVKGFENNTKKTISRYILEKLSIPEENIGVISGPNISLEIYKNKPATSVIGISPIHENNIRRIFNTNSFRAYSSNDVLGIELGGILKNIFAIGAGIIFEYNLGTNSMASYITRSLYEITKLSKYFGGEIKTFYGNSGLGDLITTCFNENSRNNKLGRLIAQEKNLEVALESIDGVVEGIQTTKIIKEILGEKIIEFPITNEIYKVLFQEKNPMEGITDLMSRENTNE